MSEKEIVSSTSLPVPTAAVSAASTHRTVVWSLTSLPSTINGIILSNVGLAVLWINLATSFHFRTPEMMATAYALTLYSTLLLVVYMTRILYDPYSWFQIDFSTPQRIFRMGIMCNAVCLIAFVSSSAELALPEAVPLGITLFSMSIQVPTMMWFIYSCIVKSCWPEPFFNAALQSCVFPVISLPGSSTPIVILRKVLLSIGLITLIPSSSIQLYRVLIPRKSEQDIVANNPSVSIMQMGWSITLVAWLLHPLTNTPVSETGQIITNLIYSISIVLDLLTWVALWQRRNGLYNATIDHPLWAAVSSPFICSAIAAIIYHNIMGSYLPMYLRYLLLIWLIFLSSVATLLVTFVNGVYFKNYFFLRNVIASDTQTSENTGSNIQDNGAVQPSAVDGLIIPLDDVSGSSYTRDLIV